MDRTGSLVLVRISRIAVGHDLDWKGRRLGVVLVHVGLDVATGLIHRGERCRVVLERYRGTTTSVPVGGDWGVDWSRELRKLLLLLLLWNHGLLKVKKLPVS